MSEFVVAIPLFNYTMAVEMYHLSYHTGDKVLGMVNDYQRMNEEFSAPGLDLVERFGIEAFAGEKRLLADVTKYQLLTDLPLNIKIDPAKLIFQIPSVISNDPDVLVKCKYLKELGYSFALQDYPLDEHEELLGYIDYIVLDYSDPRFFFKNSNLNRKLRGIVSIITNVPDMAAFRSIKSNQRALFTGEF